MTVHLYTMTWNEADMLGFFFRHYDPWVDRYVIYDDGSTDDTLKLLGAHPKVELRRFERTDASSFVLSQRQLQDHVWKESRGRADWVVVTAVDEHLHVPGQPMKTYLQRCRRHGLTCIFGLGYQMFSRQMAGADELLCQTRTRGAPFDPMSKLSLFNPEAVEETHFEVGRHRAAPTGRIKMPWRDRLLVLHYKNLGYQRALHREAFLKNGLGPTDLANGWGAQYLRTEPEFKQVWEQSEQRLEDVSCPETRPWKNHPGHRSWRRSKWWHRFHRWGWV